MRTLDRLLIFYLLSFLIIAISITLTVASIATPHWLNAKFYPEDENGEPFRITYGLHEKCSSVTQSCSRFPELECINGDRQFCNIWRTTSFMMWLSLVILGPTVISYITLICSSRQKRESGWHMISLLLFFVVCVQIIAMAAVVHLLRTDPHLKNQNWKLGASWGAATGSWIVTLGLLVLTIVVGLKTVQQYGLLPTTVSRPSVERPMRRTNMY
ncbi:hypothetical protein V1508DRAFT_422324 [Lipomyces doorenjongii]|uniref:uncharacterized protein n=1 Tax=Lipomyces doorenjongii TaxID=383834 RepID=UPI0034CE7877